MRAFKKQGNGTASILEFRYCLLPEPRVLDSAMNLHITLEPPPLLYKQYPVMIQYFKGVKENHQRLFPLPIRLRFTLNAPTTCLEKALKS